MMKMTVHRKHNIIKAFSKTRTLRRDEYWEERASQNALLLLEDHAQLTIGSDTRERLLLLSTDSLIVAKPKSLYLKLKARVSLSDIWLASCTHRVTSGKFSSKTSFVIGWPTTNYVVTLSSSETKDKWLSALQWHSVRARQRLIPTRLMVNVQLFDSAVTSVVSVDVHSTAESVVQGAIQQNGLTGGVSDYQLCVLYDGEEEMYPLISHELPYCILRHSLRGQRSRHMLGRHRWRSTDELHVTDEASESAEPRFILKHRAAIPTYIQTGFLKHKRKRSLIGWALRKGQDQADQAEGQADLQPGSNKLFGQSLASVCPDGNLPKAILDLLSMLYREGPETLGVFRRSANAKSCRILKEKLNSGRRVSLRGESVFVAASLLT
ncbi:rho GTPase-activating protein 20-like, partial [Clarias magur]